MDMHTRRDGQGVLGLILDYAINNRFLVIFFVLLIGVFGVRAAKTLPVDAVPDVTNVQVQVLTNAPGLAALEVERFITFPVEASMSGLPKLKEVRSISRFGLSAITLVFDEGTDIYFARQLVNERLSQARESINTAYGQPELGPITSGLGEIYQFEVRGEPMCAPSAPNTDKCYTTMELRAILDWQLAYALRTIDGVVEVNSFGGELKTYQVELDPNRLILHKVSLNKVFEVLEKENLNVGGAYIVRAGEQRLIRGEGVFRSVHDIEQVVLTTRADGTPVRISDVAKVHFAPMVRQGAVTRDGRGEIVTGTVMMLMGANARTVSREVDQTLQALASTLPKGVRVETYYDRTQLINRTIRTVAINLIEGGVLVIVVLLLLLGNLRGGLLVASIIPLSLLATFIVMKVLGVSANLMSLGALDFGLIIDGAVIMVENAVRVLGKPENRGKNVRQMVFDSSREIARPMIFAVAIIILVYMPILSLQGIEGKMFRPMAITVISALVAALILSLTFVPAMASVLYRNGVEHQEAWLFTQAKRLYTPLLKRSVRAPKKLSFLALLLFVLSLGLIPLLGAEFIPKLDEGAIALQAVRPPSVALEESIKATQRIERAIKSSFPDEVETVVSRTGRAEIATDPMGVELSDIYVMLHPREKWTRASSKQELVQLIESILIEEVPGQNYSFSQPIELRTNELISGARSDVAINLYGQDLETLKKIGDDIVKSISTLPGARDVQADQLTGLPTLRILANRKALGRYGLETHDVLNAVEAMGGKVVGEVLEGQARYNIQVRLSGAVRKNPRTLRNILLTTPNGHVVPLGQVAQLIEEDGPAQIGREAVQRRRTIQANVRGQDVASFVADAKDKIRKDVQIPPGYRITWGGQFKNLEEASERLFVAVPLALLLIFLLLYMIYGSFRPALLIYLNVPLATTGGLVALWARDMPLSISAGVGFIALSGIAVLNGVVMVSYFQELQKTGLNALDAAEQGALLRLRPILMTAFTDAIGFLPMAIATSAGAEVQRPLATVVIGGLFTSTLLTLFVLPSLYAWVGVVKDKSPDIITKEH